MAETIIRPAVPEAFEQFGSAVASGRDTLVVGAQHDAGVGRVYVFVWNGSAWAEQAMLQASDRTGLDHFGASVALSGDALVVAAPGAGAAGQAYVFRRAGGAWSEEAVLRPSGASSYGFAASVAIDGDDVLVGGNQAAYFYRRGGTTWTETARVTPPSASAGSRFGGAVAVHGDHAVVGDEWEGGAAPHHGSAGVFRRNGTGWAFVPPLLTSPDPRAYDHFGQAVAIHGDRLIVGAPGVVGGGVVDAGAAYVYVKVGVSWGLEQKLEPAVVDLPHLVHDFGAAVSLSGEFAVVGNPTDHHPHPGSGAAHLFQRSGSRWTRVPPVLRAMASGQFDYYGDAVSVSDAGVFVGARDVRVTDYSQGLVYAYALPADLADRLRVHRDWARYAKVLFGLISGGPGVIIEPGSGPAPVDPEPFVEWSALDRGLRQRLVAEALRRVAETIDDRKLRERVVEVARAVAKKAGDQR
ncbi:MAG: hypothetical protein AB7H93_20265 [Vicinamibacterales bacterium]